MKNTIKTLFILTFALFITYSTSAQTVDRPVCISQNAANICRDNALENSALKAKIIVLEEALKEKDANTKDAQDTARLNETDLKARLQATEIELAKRTQETIDSAAERVRLMAIMEFLLQNTKRRSKIGLIVF